MKHQNSVARYLCLIVLVVTSEALFAQSDPAPNPNCTLLVPANPLSARGLATPYQLTATDPNGGDCHETNPDQSAFVQAAILHPATGQVSIYNPLVVDLNTGPAVPPVVPSLPANAIVGIWFGYNGGTLTLQAAPGVLSGASCVNGVASGNFGQFAYCNAPAFFKAAHRAIRSGRLHVPPLGIAVDGKPCPSVRDFFAVDQDQSDNLPTTYLNTGIGMAQKTQATVAQFPDAIGVGNPSDNRLVDVALAGALSCTPWTAPDLADPGSMVPALPLNELQARLFQKSPVALVPVGDPMVRTNGHTDLSKVNAYRRGVDQPQVHYAFEATTARYCRQMYRTAPARMLLDLPYLVPDAAHATRGASPDPAAADSLFTFLAQRFAATWDILGCADLIHLPNPISVTANAEGVVTAASINTIAYSRRRQWLSSCQRQDDSNDDASKAATATE
jgi:hypothetical protein